MTVYVDLVTKLAKNSDIEGVIRIGKWVAENEGRSESLALEIIKIIESHKHLPPSHKLSLYTVANNLGQTIETDQRTLKGIEDSTPAYLQKEESISTVKVFPDTAENQLSYARFLLSDKQA